LRFDMTTTRRNPSSIDRAATSDETSARARATDEKFVTNASRRGRSRSLAEALGGRHGGPTAMEARRHRTVRQLRVHGAPRASSTLPRRRRDPPRERKRPN
jgi:hypothetical protein